MQRKQRGEEKSYAAHVQEVTVLCYQHRDSELGVHKQGHVGKMVCFVCDETMNFHQIFLKGP